MAGQVGAALLQELPEGLGAPVHLEPSNTTVSSHSFVPTKQLDTLWITNVPEMPEMRFPSYCTWRLHWKALAMCCGCSRHRLHSVVWAFKLNFPTPSAVHVSPHNSPGHSDPYEKR